MALTLGAEAAATIQNWMRSRDVIEFLGLWETLHNPNFKPLKIEGVKSRAGSNAFTLSPKHWLEAVAAIGIYSKSGRYGGTFAHRDVAFEMKRVSFRKTVEREVYSLYK